MSIPDDIKRLEGELSTKRQEQSAMEKQLAADQKKVQEDTAALKPASTSWF